MELLSYHAGWNFALGRQVGDPAFHPTVLVYFRNRLIQHQQSRVVFEEILQGLMEAGLVERRGRQRLDSTHVLGVVREMSRLECVRESLRLALQELEASAAAFAAPAFWAVLWERYVTSKLDYRTSVEGLKQAMDGAYVSGQKLAVAAAEGRELIGPAQPAPKKEGRFSTEDFSVNVEAREAVCPAGESSTQCSQLKEEASGKVAYRFEWSWRCRDCAQRDRCVGRGQKHRTLVVGEHHSHLQARPTEQKTEAFRKKCHRRNAVEGTQSELVRAHGLRRARYRGEAKVRQQNYFIGAACNAKRWIRRVMWELRQGALGAKIGVETG